ncbi:5-formyltetrahydrofolate cyclo-ligase [Pedobacter immunditicola]|uniref:5-formyltetrahydrofolate cyclo-ligase n=1 Tax=Pedobacter immunditicola TaxID=3133440 RepID=UPI0030B76AE7
MNKAEIRKAAMQRRNALSPLQLQELSQQLLTQFSRLDLSTVNVIHLFLPIEKKKEPDTYLMIDWLQLHHPAIKILVPRADFNTALMTHHVYTDSKGLEKNIFDIMEPQNEHAHQGDIDMVLIPLLAFDQHGYRVGYGKGFYDRFLQGISTKKVGLSLFPPLAEITDTDVHDVRMDLCLTPDKIYEFD